MTDYDYYDSFEGRGGAQPPPAPVSDPPRRAGTDSVAVEMLFGVVIGAVVLFAWCWLHSLAAA